MNTKIKEVTAKAFIFFLLITLIPASLLIHPVSAAALEEIDFDFTVDAGRGEVDKLGVDYFQINMVADHNGDAGWFGFNVTANGSGKTIEFRSVQAGNLWSDTWCYPVYSDDNGETWQECDDISIPTEGEGRVLYFEVTPSADTFLVYAAYPILYTQYEEWIATVETDENCTVTSDVVSGGEELYLITVTATGGAVNRPTLWIICGQDPPETWAQNAGIGMVNFLLSADADADRLRTEFIWKIVPVSNPNAVRHGFTTHNTDDAGGEEINIDWTSPSELETIAMKGDIAGYIAGGGNVVLILDMHCAMGAMPLAGSGIWGLNNAPNTTYAYIWADDVMAGTLYNDNPAVTSGSQGTSRVRGYAQTLGVAGATLELFQNQNYFDWGDPKATMDSIKAVGESLALSLEDYAALWSVDGGEPEPPAPSGTKPTYTEMIDSFTIASSGSWVDHNITLGENVPAGSVAEIVMLNIGLDAAGLMGVRYDGSSEVRYIDICPAENIGGSAVRMLVNVSLTGMIECYAEVKENTTFYVTGYWTGAKFTEIMYNMPFDADLDGIDVWTNFDVNALAGIPVNSTIGVIIGNGRLDGLRQGGVRTDGSAVNRMLDLGQAIIGGLSVIDTYVQSDPATGIIEAQSEYFTHILIYLTGYFDYSVNFSEAWTTSGISAASWTDLDLTASIFNDTDIVDYTLCNIYTTDVAASHGVRENGDSTVRLVPQADSSDGGPAGFGMSANTDATGNIELYSSCLNELFKYGGYFRTFALGEEEPEPSAISGVMKTSVVSIGKMLGTIWANIYSVSKIPK